MASHSCIPSSSSSSSSTYQWEVFLSFRGEDIRGRFVDHLYTALYQKRIPTFKDDEKLETGRPIGPELLKAIKESWCYIVVLSEKYASSSWCLEELVHILHSGSCKNNAVGRRRGTIYPVFYHVDPSDVRHQKGSFGDGLAKAASKHGEVKAQKWRKALKEVADLSGLHYPSNQYRSESKLIEDLVSKICSEGEGIYANITEDLIGIHSRVEKVIQLLGLGLDDHARAVGICGMGGIGKTTIAKEVYRRIRYQFEASSYLENDREVSTRSGLLALQQQLISEILGPKDLGIINTFTGERMITNRVCNKKVLIIFDDVDQVEQLENLLGKLDQFNVGSRIIITTRDKQVLTAYGVRDMYEVKMLNRDESIKLFISKAFGNKQQQTRAFEDLMERAAKYAGGVPLALKVLGSSLKGKKESEWESALNRLKELPDQKVFQVLKISYDALNDSEKEIFLDIACFLKGENITRATQILDSCGFYAEIGISVLVDKSLISFDHDRVWMHDLIQELGWDIVRKKSTDPGNRSRLWIYNDVSHVLMNNTGTKAVQSIVLPFSEKRELLNLGAKAFAKMTELRLLKIHNVQLPNGLEYLPSKLRYLDWDGYPLKCIPQTFQLEYLANLCLSNSCLEQFWDGKLRLPNLREVVFFNLPNLTKCPDFTEASKLESVIFRDCKSLVDAHQLVGVLTKLKKLYLIGCMNLRSLPTSMDCESLEFLKVRHCSKLLKFPKILGKPKSLQKLTFTRTGVTQFFFVGHLTNLYKLKLTDSVDIKSLPSKLEFESLKTLDLSGCSKLMNIPKIFGNLKCLEVLRLHNTGIIELPLSVGHLDNLYSLDLSDCQNLRSLPSELEFKSLTLLNLFGCSKLMNIPEIFGNMKCLEELRLQFTGIIELPLSVGHLDKLLELGLGYCQNLRSLPDSICQLKALYGLDLRGCSKLEKLPSSSGVHRLNLSRLSIDGCKKITSDSLDSFFSLSLSEERLTTLEMGECNLKSVPAAICKFSRLESLKLNGNDFEILPDGMNRLSRLRTLNLKGCKRLEELPELTPRLAWMLASDCQSLRTILSPSTYKNLTICDFGNCISLLGNEQILDELLKAARQRYLSQRRTVSDLSYRGQIRLPGCEIPKWFSRDKVELHLTNRRMLHRGMWPLEVDKIYSVWRFAACAVVEIEKIYNPRCSLVAQIDIEGRPIHHLVSNVQWRPTDTENLWITFGHFCLPIDEVDRLNKLGGSEFATFTITSTLPGFKIKSYGLHISLIEDDNDDDDDDYVAASKPKRRRLGCNETGNLNDNIDDDDDDDDDHKEEEDKHPNNNKQGQLFEPTARDLDLNEEATVGPSGSRSLDEEKEDPSMDLQLWQFSEPIAMDLDLNEEERVGPSGSRSLDEEEEHPSMDLQFWQFFEPTAMDLDLKEEATVGPSGSRSLDEEEEDPSMDLQLRI